MARIPERVNFPIQPAHAFKTLLPSPPVGVCSNKDGTSCAVGGRNLLKIFSIEEKSFNEKTNLIVGTKKLDYPLTDVQWHPIEENYLASSTGNGVVLIWDLNKVGTESKQDHLFHQHFRSVKKLCFHPSDPNLLMSCSQDGNMHLLDIRQKKLVEIFRGKADGIFDVQFHPTDKEIFCAACESGNVQLWDIRKPDHHYTQFTAHSSGPVYTLNWHPEDRYLLATGGRDKSIKIWNTQHKTHHLQIIRTISPVARVKWRPNHKNHIASCVYNLDNNITIWDIGRPYVPYAIFEEHTDITTDFIWQRDPDVIISCSKDKYLCNNIITNAKRPAEESNPVALGLSPTGLIGHALSNKIERFVSLKSNQANAIKIPLLNQPMEFKPELSSLSLYDLNNEQLESSELSDEMLLKNLAQEYRFYGRSLCELCKHNAAVSTNYGLSEKALTWSIIMELYKTDEESTIDPSLPSPMSQNSVISFASEKINRKLETPETSLNRPPILESESNFSSTDEEGLNTPCSILQGATQLKGDIQVMGPEFAVFDDDDDDNNQLFSADLENEENEFYALPKEAIQLRQPFSEKVFQHQDGHQGQDAHDNHHDRNRRSHHHHSFLPYLSIPDWSFEKTVKEMVCHYAENGDIQMAVTMMLVLQHRVKGMIDKEDESEWFTGYLEILYRFQLFNIATEVINHAPEPINSTNHDSTTYHMQCSMCNKTIQSDKHGCYCKRCEKITQTCAICHIPVKGLFSWCQGCGHGGHLNHMKEWYKLYSYCPTGCGHKCEFS